MNLELCNIKRLEKVSKMLPGTSRAISKKLKLSPTHTKRIIKEVYKTDFVIECVLCGQFKEAKEFGKFKTKKGNFSQSRVCPECREIQRERRREGSHLRYQVNKARAVKLFGSQCGKCHQHFPDMCFDFHHLNETTKKGNPSYFLKGSWKTSQKELEKCIMVCKNCHAIIHFGGK